MSLRRGSERKENIRRSSKAFFVVAALLISVFSRTAEALPPLPLQCQAPEWMAASMKSSMGAVWRELQTSRLPRQSALNALALVASRLFPGYAVSISKGQVTIRPEEKWNWRVELEFPSVADRLPECGKEWLNADMQGAVPELEEIMRGIPPEALGWNSGKFHAKLSSIITKNVPGWRCAAKISADDHDVLLKVNIYPEEPLLLAVTSETLSNTMPQIIADRISDRTVEFMSPFTGLPLAWVEHHKSGLTQWLAAKQLDDKWLSALRASSENSVAFKPVSKVTTEIDSTTFSLRGWFSVHAGSSARLEAGVHFGHYFSAWNRLPSEVYTELIFGLEDWDFDSRVGLRFSPHELVWLGVEGARRNSEHLWLRLWVNYGRSNAYGWLRYGNEDTLEAAIGYRLNRYVSLELYYDSREDDRVSLRALSNL